MTTPGWFPLHGGLTFDFGCWNALSVVYMTSRAQHELFLV